METNITKLKRRANKLYFEAIKLEYKENDNKNYGTKKNGFFYTRKDLFNEMIFLNIPISLLDIINIYAHNYIYNLADIYNTYPHIDNIGFTYVYKKYSIELVNEICYVVNIYTKKLFDQYHVLYLTELRKTGINLDHDIIYGFFKEDDRIVLRGNDGGPYDNINLLEITFCENNCVFKEKVKRREIRQTKDYPPIFEKDEEMYKNVDKLNENNKLIDVLELHNEFSIYFIVFLCCNDSEQNLYLLHYDQINGEIITCYPLNLRLMYYHADICFNRVIDNLEIIICDKTGEHIYLFQKHII